MKKRPLYIMGKDDQDSRIVEIWVGEITESPTSITDSAGNSFSCVQDNSEACIWVCMCGKVKDLT